MLALIMKNNKIANYRKSCLNNGLILFFYFMKKAVRITPPLTISEK